MAAAKKPLGLEAVICKEAFNQFVTTVCKDFKLGECLKFDKVLFNLENNVYYVVYVYHLVILLFMMVTAVQ